MKIDINISDNFLDAEIKTLEGINIHVGILDKQKQAKTAKPNTEKMVGNTGQKGRRVGKNAEITLGQLAIYLDNRYGVFTDAADNFNNQDLNVVTQELIKAFSGDPVNERRIQNAAIALIRNPIMRKDFGSNAKTTVDGGIGYNGYKVQGKGFDWPMVDTGTFFTNIKAKITHG